MLKAVPAELVGWWRDGFELKYLIPNSHSIAKQMWDFF